VLRRVCVCVYVVVDSVVRGVHIPRLQGGGVNVNVCVCACVCISRLYFISKE